MSNAPQKKTINQHKVTGIQVLLPFFFSLSCLLTVGCKTSGNSIVPFYGDGTAINSPASEFPSEQAMNPAQQITINDSPGPAVPSTPTSPATTLGAPNTYDPPDMLPARSSLSDSTYAQDNMTMVYDIPPDTQTNSGGTAGSLSPTYYSSPASVGRTPSSSNGFVSPATIDRGSDFGRNNMTGSGTPGFSNGTSSGESSSYDSSGYGDSTTDNRYYHGPSNGHTSSLVPTGSQLEDGDYLTANGTMTRVINGKAYELVQYITRTPPILPDLSDLTQSQSSSLPQILQTATQVQISTDYRTAIQMTDQFGKVPIPEYESLLDRQENGLHVLSQGVVTVAVPAEKTTIFPGAVPVETVSSLDYSEYSNIGAIQAPSSMNHGVGGDVDEEMQRSIWTIMANQNHDLLLYSPKTK